MNGPIRVTVWNENVHEQSEPEVRRVYPRGIHGALQDALSAHAEFEVRTATLDEAEQGLAPDVLDSTDVLLWWAHEAHEQVSDDTARRVQERVVAGMGFVPLHSAHYSKPFRALLGTSGSLSYRVAGERERIWVVAPGHPIAAGCGRFIELEHEEMYGEPFDVPPPQELVFVSWFAGGEVFRSGLCYTRGRGRIFYFRPGHETYPTYHDASVKRVIANAVRWAAPRDGIADGFPRPAPAEPREPL
jgi:trehalose utilization protein